MACRRRASAAKPRPGEADDAGGRICLLVSPNRRCWATYLQQRGARCRSDRLLSRPSTRRRAPGDRPYLLNSWAIALQDYRRLAPARPLALYRAAVRSSPISGSATTTSRMRSGCWAMRKAAWRAGEDMRRAAGSRPGRAPEKYYQNWDALTWNLAGMARTPPLKTRNPTPEPELCRPQWGRAGRSLCTHARCREPPNSPLRPPRPTAMTRASARSPILFTAVGRRGRRYQQVGGRDGSVQARLRQSLSLDQLPGLRLLDRARRGGGRASRQGGRELKSAGTFVDCYRFRGDILDGRGDWTGAQTGVCRRGRAGPRPAGWVLLLGLGAGAAWRFCRQPKPNSRTQMFAGPIGPIRSRHGAMCWRSKVALRMHSPSTTAALKLAPNWTALKEARAAAAR